MSTLPPVVSRFVDYYATLDAQPPSALVGLYHRDATLVDPFGEHNGLLRSSAISPICWRMSKTAVLPLMPPSERTPVCRHLDNALVAPAHCRGPLDLLGCSVVDTENDLITRQRDYYDAGR